MRSGRRLRMAVLCAAQVLNVVAISAVNIAIPTIGAELDAGGSTLQWVVSAYLLTFGGCLLVCGRLADLFGRRRVFVLGLLVFAVGAVGSALSPGPVALILLRGVQGIGTAAALPASLGLLTSTFTTPQERSRAFAAFGAAGAVGFATGVLLGGLGTQVLGWRWVFALMALPALAAIGAMGRAIPADEPPGPHTRRVDVFGAVTSTLGLLGLVLGLTNAGRSGWDLVAVGLPIGAGIVLIAVFLAGQLRVPAPLIPPDVWRQPGFASAAATAFCIFASWIGGNYYLSLTLQEELGYSAAAASLAFLLLPLVGFVFSGVAGRLVTRAGVRPILLLGLVVYALGASVFALIGSETSYIPVIGGGLTLAVIGNAFGFVSSNVLAMAHAPEDRQSLVAGVFNTAMQAGGVVGLAVMSVAVGAWPPGGGGRANAPAFVTAAAICVLGFGFALLPGARAAESPG